MADIKRKKPSIPGSPLYQVIFKHFREKIISGSLAPGSRLPTEMEIAQEFNVSRITVTRALSELERNRFIRRVRGSGSYVNEEGLWMAPSATREADSKLSIISLVLPFEGNFSYSIFKGIEDAARENSYLVTFHNSSDKAEAEKKIIEDLRAKGAHGIILYPAENPQNMDIYSSLLIDRYPFVLIDRRIHGLDAPLVMTDNRKGFFDITSHLIELGHRRIIFAGASVYRISSELERYNGFCDAHISHGIPLLHRHLYTADDIQEVPQDYRTDETPDSRLCNYIFDLFENMDREERPTAIAAVNDFIAELIIRTALKRGIQIPGDYSVSGFDNLPFSSHPPVSLTTAAQPVYEIGRMAAEELFKRIRFPGRKPAVHILESSLILRQSTSSPKP